MAGKELKSTIQSLLSPSRVGLYAQTGTSGRLAARLHGQERTSEDNSRIVGTLIDKQNKRLLELKTNAKKGSSFTREEIKYHIQRLDNEIAFWDKKSQVVQAIDKGNVDLIVKINTVLKGLTEEQQAYVELLEDGDNEVVSFNRDLKAFAKRKINTKIFSAKMGMMSPFQDLAQSDNLAGFLTQSMLRKIKGKNVVSRGVLSMFGLSPRINTNTNRKNTALPNNNSNNRNSINNNVDNSTDNSSDSSSSIDTSFISKNLDSVAVDTSETVELLKSNIESTSIVNTRIVDKLDNVLDILNHKKLPSNKRNTRSSLRHLRTPNTSVNGSLVKQTVVNPWDRNKDNSKDGINKRFRDKNSKNNNNNKNNNSGSRFGMLGDAVGSAVGVGVGSKMWSGAKKLLGFGSKATASNVASTASTVGMKGATGAAEGVAIASSKGGMLGKFGGMLGKHGKLLGRLAVPLAIAASIPNLMEAIDSKDSKKIGGAVGSTTGGIGGAIGGAAIGTAIFPVVGTIIGGLIGGFAGDFLGEKAGNVAGGIFDKIKGTLSDLTDTIKDSVESNETLIEGINWGRTGLGGFVDTVKEGTSNAWRNTKRAFTGETVTPIAGSAGLGGLSAGFESGSRGSSAIGNDSTGGASYGKYQISTKRGTMSKFMDFLKTNNPEAYKQLSQAGDPSSSTGTFAAKWQELASNGTLGNSEHEFIKSTHFDPAYKNIDDPNLRSMIENSKALQDVLWSTAVQHGAGGAASIFNKVYKPGMSQQALVSAVYAERATKFGKSTPAERASVQARFGKEQQLASAGVSQETTVLAASSTPASTANSNSAQAALANVNTPNGNSNSNNTNTVKNIAGVPTANSKNPVVASNTVPANVQTIAANKDYTSLNIPKVKKNNDDNLLSSPTSINSPTVQAARIGSGIPSA